MNYPVIGQVLSWILCTEGALMLLPCIISLIYREDQGMIYFALAILAIALGYLTGRRKVKNKAIYQAGRVRGRGPVLGPPEPLRSHSLCAHRRDPLLCGCGV